MNVRQYSPSDSSTWNDFVRRSKNGTFLFDRGYMDYHDDRFTDSSLMVYDDGGSVAAVLPAHRNDATLVSHGGLTYGGFLTDRSMKLPKMLSVFEAVFAYLRDHAVATLVYKTIPWIYHSIPAEEDRYALFLVGARLIRRGVITVIGCEERPPFQERRARGAKKARTTGVTITQSADWAAYWALLTERLQHAYNATPVHSLQEIQMLATRFPDNIKLFGAMRGNELIAGTVIHETPRVARAQYIAASEAGRRCSGLDLLFYELLSAQYASKPFFEFGTSDEKGGRAINRGLIDQKEGYGARVVGHDHYEIDVPITDPNVFIEALR